ncbi:MAG TPA: hypothetical protein VN828_23240 [Acidobacteriaceae bacterium]|nr:hypothetical protein [Acidobacteriaceae bacterium]
MSFRHTQQHTLDGSQMSNIPVARPSLPFHYPIEELVIRAAIHCTAKMGTPNMVLSLN